MAVGTREGDVFQPLFGKLEEERKALGGKVFDILGKLSFDNKPLRELLIDAIRYGNDPETRERLNTVMDSSLNREKLEEMLTERALTEDIMNQSTVTRIREDMERMEARKLHLLGTGAMVDGIVEDEHVDAIRLSQGSERGMNDGGGKLCREPAPVDSARVHEAVERILAERHGGALEMHLRVDGTLLEHHAENQQEDAEDRDAAKLVRICRTEDATDLIATEKDLHFLRKQFLVLVVLCYTVHSMSLHWMFFV